MEQSRVLLAVVLSLGVMYVYYTWIDPYSKAQRSAPTQEVATQNGQPQTLPAVPVNSGAIPVPSSTAAITSPPVAQIKDDQIVYLENQDIKVGISVKSGVVVDSELKTFHVDTDKKSPLIQLIDKDGQALSYTDGSQNQKQEFTLKESSASKVVLQSQSGTLALEKTIELSSKDNPYLVSIAIVETNQGADLVLNPTLWIVKKQKAPKTGTGIFSYIHEPEDFFLPMSYVEEAQKVQGTSTSNEKNQLINEKDWKRLPDRIVTTGRISWTAIGDRYFLTSLIARTDSDGQQVSYGKQGENVYTSLSYGPQMVKAGDKATFHYSAYFGPKDLENLKSIGVNLEKSVDYGWFGAVAQILLALLKFFYRLVGNWGLAIILLTFLVKLILHPVNKKSMKSMKAMQKLQPQLAEIKEKYANNKEKLNTEMMLLFKTHKVNPMSGCLPMVAQMPIYIALYKVLWNSIELYHSPFFGFYRDLSRPDPYFISPVLLGLVMALQQKLTPTTAQVDPMQQKMMMLMPIMFSAFMLFFPSGLVIYILVNTLMSVVQQYMIHRDIDVLDLMKRKFSH